MLDLFLSALGSFSFPLSSFIFVSTYLYLSFPFFVTTTVNLPTGLSPSFFLISYLSACFCLLVRLSRNSSPSVFSPLSVSLSPSLSISPPENVQITSFNGLNLMHFQTPLQGHEGKNMHPALTPETTGFQNNIVIYISNNH